MANAHNKAIALSVALHAFLFLLLVSGLPAIFEPRTPPEPQAITVDILPIREISNVKPHESREEKKEKEKEKKAESKKPSPPVKTVENKAAPPKEEKETKEKKKEKTEEKKEKKKEKMKEEDLLAVLKAVKETADKEAKKNEKAEEKQEKPAKSDNYNPELPLSLSEKDAIKGQIEKCWNVPAGARDAQDLVIVLHAQYQRDGSLITVALADKSRARYDTDPFFQAAADSALRAVRMCTPLHDLSPEKYETWKDMEMTFDPKEMLQ